MKKVRRASGNFLLESAFHKDASTAVLERTSTELEAVEDGQAVVLIERQSHSHDQFPDRYSDSSARYKISVVELIDFIKHNGTRL